MIWIGLKKKEMKKIKPIKKTWHDWLMNYIPKAIKRNVSGFKDKIASLFKTNPPKKLCMEKERN